MFYAESTNGFYDLSIHGENIPSDAVEITSSQHAALLLAQSSGMLLVADADGNPVAVDPPAPTVQQIVSSFTKSIQSRLDVFANTRGYDGILSACTYAASAVPKFAAEGLDAVNARDATWASCYTIMADVQAGIDAKRKKHAGKATA